MSDYISRQDVLNELDGCDYELKDWQRWKLKTMVRDIPSAQPERKKGEWIWISSTYDRTPCEMVYECNKCHHKTIVQSLGMDSPWEKFCPNCGADMRGERSC